METASLSHQRVYNLPRHCGIVEAYRRAILKFREDEAELHTAPIDANGYGDVAARVVACHFSGEFIRLHLTDDPTYQENPRVLGTQLTAYFDQYGRSSI